MKQWKRGLNRITAIALAAILVGTTVDMSAFTVYAAESMQSGLCEHHTEHTDACGYKEAVEGSPCTFVCDVCASEEEGTLTCTCTEKCVEGEVNSDCAICSAEDADLTACTGQETPAEPTCTCEATEGEPHAEECPLYEAPACVCEEFCNGMNFACPVCAEDFGLCAHYVPTCYCAEKCTEDNFNEFCDICASDYTACGGEGESASYAEDCAHNTIENNICTQCGLYGTCGTNLTWELTLNSDGTTYTLTISGTGAMTNYASQNRTPWCSYLTSITKVDIGDGVTNIGTSAFESCSSLTSVTIGNSVTSIGEYAFIICSGLTSVTIPESVTSIGLAAFSDCSSLTAINVDSGNAVYKSVDGVLFTKDGTTLVAFPGGKTGGYTIPASVTSIGENAFYGCSSLTSITIPENVTSIGNIAFGGCSSLTSVTIPDGVTAISYMAFRGCSSLTEITIPDSVTSIGENAFYDCSSLTSVTIPDGVTAISYKAFRECSSLESVTIPASVESIGDYAFWYCKNLTSVTIPDSVKSIGGKAFDGCSNLCVHYLGTEDQWNTVTVGTDALSDTKGIHCVGDKPTWTPDAGGSTHSWHCSEEGCNAVIKTEDHINTEVKNVKAATCTAEGYTGDTYCKDCKGRTAIGTEIPMKNHTGGTATCTKKAVCSVCGKEYGSVDSSKHGGTEVKGAKEANCTAGGYTGDTYCKDCGVKIASGTSTETLNHSYQDVEVTKKATTRKNGTMNQKCSSCGSTKNTAIYAAKTVKLSATSYTYNGKVKKPSVTVTDSKGNTLKNETDYTVSYAKGGKNVGKYTVTITLKGKYSGTIEKTFTIKPKTTSISRLSAAKKGFTVKWKKQKSQTTGYEIQYSTSSKFTKNTTKTVKITKNSTTSKSITKLKAKKKYYVRVRTYKTVKVNGKSTKIYSDWSTAKNVTTKK